MKKVHLKRTFALAASAVAISTAFVGCRDYDQFDVEQASMSKLSKEYEDAFISAFGVPDPDQDWGMSEKIGAIGAFSSDGTRAGTVEVNRNQWTEHTGTTTVQFPDYGTGQKNITVPVYRDGALGHDIQIPGWPHLNGLYYAANGNVLQGAYTGSELNSINIPAGDVTPYEIQYVSNWFRTHQITNPEDYRLNLHLSDFFIQNVSCDYDQVEYRRSGITPYQGWPSTGNNGKNIATKEEAKAHSGINGNPYIVNGNLNEAISYDLDNLGFKSIDDEWTHVNNFNRGNSNFSPEDNQNNPNREIKYIKSAGTEDFRCHPSWCTNTDWIYSWVLVRLTWNETVKDSKSPYFGCTIPREGYYLAFDFHGEKSGQIVNQDGYYSNWIIKITPGYFNPAGRSRRIFCEDLGGSFDFDFNDAVIDVAFERTAGNSDDDPNARFIPIISVQAAGGTMPIYVEKHPTGKPQYELHNMLGTYTSTPVNVGGYTHPIAVYRGDEVTSTSPGNIHIYVENTRDNVNYEISGVKTDPTDTNEDERSYDENGKYITLDGEKYYVKTENAPRAFAAPTTVQWMKEIKHIDDVYTNFKEWVKTPKSYATWYNTKSDKASELLFDDSVIKPEKDNPTGGGGSGEVVAWDDLTPDAGSKTIVAAVGADSYMKINGYDGDDPSIFSNLDGMGDNGRITITVVLSSSTQYNQVGSNGLVSDANKLQAVLVPADISGSSMSNNGQTFTASGLTAINSATLVEGNHEFGQDVNTYTLQFSFTKAQMLNSTHTSESVGPYHDYLLLFLKVGSNNIGTGNAEGTNNGVKVEHWYVHY